LIPTLLLTSTVLLLVDNFTYTVSGSGLSAQQAYGGVFTRFS